MAANNILSLDIGEKRIGVARVNMLAKLPQALTTFKNDDTFLTNLQNLIKEYHTDTIVVGLPRNMSGQETKQTEYVKEFTQQNLSNLDCKIIFVDETLSSVEAQNRLNSAKYGKKDIDATAAVIILEDYLRSL